MTIFFTPLATSVTLIVLTVVSAVAQPTLSLSSMTAEAGDTFQLELTFNTDGEAVSALSTDIIFDSSVIHITGTNIGPAANSADKMIIENEVNPGVYRVGILSLTNAYTIGNGIVAHINGTIDSDVADPIVPLFQNASGSDPNGMNMNISGLDSDLRIGSSDRIVILMDTSRNTTITAGDPVQVYGTPGINHITLERGAKAALFNIPGNNKITIQVDSSQFTVYRSGASVHFEGEDGTSLNIPATLSGQTIIFNDMSLELVITDNQVMLGDQAITSTGSLISQQAEEATVTNSLGMTFVQIQPGTFMMGSPEDEPGREYDENQHQVTLTQGYYVQTTEVTQGQWKSVMGSNPSGYPSCGDDCPVESVSWNDVQEFITQINQRGEGTYRLPTEAQWEYAARAGSTTAFANGEITETGPGRDPNLDVMGRYLLGWAYDNGGYGPHPVAQKQANAWGLYDMHGNVWEWCQDYWYEHYSFYAETDPEGPSTGAYRVSRGGSWYNYARHCRSASRSGNTPGTTSASIGFRLVLSLGQQ